MVPVLGPIPSPFVALVVSLLAGYLIARLLGAHAGWLGSRWADLIRRRIATGVESEIREHALAPLDRLEDARRRLRTAAAAVEETCGDR